MPTWPWRKPRPGVDEYGRSPLWYQAMDGNLDGLEQSLDEGLDATASDKDGFSSLHVACEYGHSAVVARLIASGADVNCTDKHGNGPLWVATRCARKADYSLDIVADLIRAGADMTHCNAVGKNPAGWAMDDRLQSIYRSFGYEGEFGL